jgi:hypothetical protein
MPYYLQTKQQGILHWSALSPLMSKALSFVHSSKGIDIWIVRRLEDMNTCMNDKQRRPLQPTRYESLPKAYRIPLEPNISLGDSEILLLTFSSKFRRIMAQTSHVRRSIAIRYGILTFIQASESSVLV